MDTEELIQEKLIITKNVTNVKYNNRLKIFMRKMRKDLDYCFEILSNDYDLHELGDTQEIMRDYIENHKDEIDYIIENKPLYKPDFFALLIVAGSDFDSNNSYDDCLTEYKNNVVNMDFDNEDEDKTKCVCGKEIKCLNSYISWSNKTNFRYVLGCDCITKNKIMTTWSMASYEKKRKFNIFKNKLYLYGVDKDKIDEWFYCGGNKTGKNLFKKLYKDSPHFECANECVCGRNMSGLENHYISKDNENFLVICKDCKKFFKKTSNQTECHSRLKPDQTQCHSCLKPKGENNHMIYCYDCISG